MLFCCSFVGAVLAISFLLFLSPGFFRQLSFAFQLTLVPISSLPFLLHYILLVLHLKMQSVMVSIKEDCPRLTCSSNLRCFGLHVSCLSLHTWGPSQYPPWSSKIQVVCCILSVEGATRRLLPSQASSAHLFFCSSHLQSDWILATNFSGGHRHCLFC